MKTRYLKKNSGSVGGKCQVWFRCGVTIRCVPPYVQGKIDSCWVSNRKLNPYDKAACEQLVGMKLEPLEPLE